MSAAVFRFLNRVSRHRLTEHGRKTWERGVRSRVTVDVHVWPVAWGGGLPSADRRRAKKESDPWGHDGPMNNAADNLI